MARIVAIVVAVLAAMPAAALGAQRGAAQQQAPPAQQQLPLQSGATQQAPAPVQQQPVQQPTQANSGSLSGGQAVLVGLGIVALIGGIWLVIARDARRVTAGRVRTFEDGRGGSPTRAARRSRKLSAAERRRRRRGRAR